MTATKSNTERGTVIVEAAFTLLLLLIFLLGLVEVGRFISVQQVLTNAAREGARLRVAPRAGTELHPLLVSASEVNDKVRPFLAAAGVNPDQVKMCVNDEAWPPLALACPSLETTYPPNGNLVYTKVHLEIPYQVVTLSMFRSLSITLRAEALMRNETSP